MENKTTTAPSSKNPNEPIKIVFFGTPEFSAYILEKLVKFSNASSDPIFKIHTVITNPDRPVGRKQEVLSSNVSQIADKYQVPTLKPEKLDEQFITDNHDLLDADLFIVVSYGKIIPQSLLNIPKLGALNIHGSILPKFRGASPIQNAILNGESETGITLMLMDSKMDHGDILLTNSIDILDKDNYSTLSTKLSHLSATTLIDFLPKFIRGEVAPIPQNHDLATFTKLITKDDGYFDINNPPTPEVLDRMIRAYFPWPTAWTKWNGKIIKFLPDNMIQIEGKNPVSIKEFLNGYPDFPLKEFLK